MPMFKNCPFICKKQLLRNEIHSSLLDINYEANVQSSFGIKTSLIFFFFFWLNQVRLKALNFDLETEIRLTLA